jgi:hypothetical protein
VKITQTEKEKTALYGDRSVSYGTVAVKSQKIDVFAVAVAYGRSSTAICVVVKECIHQPVKDSRRTITDVD